MKRHILHRFRASLSAVLMSSVLPGVTASVSAGELAVARYSTLRAVPTVEQRDPLAGVVRMTFPNSVSRVGEAIETLLARSGYRLVDSQAADPESAALFALPLPKVHRELGPTPLRRALQTLAGPAFTVVDNPLHRLVTFERCDPKTGGKAPTMRVAPEPNISPAEHRFTVGEKKNVVRCRDEAPHAHNLTNYYVSRPTRWSSPIRDCDD